MDQIPIPSALVSLPQQLPRHAASLGLLKKSLRLSRPCRSPSSTGIGRIRSAALDALVDLGFLRKHLRGGRFSDPAMHPPSGFPGGFPGVQAAKSCWGRRAQGEFYCRSVGEFGEHEQIKHRQTKNPMDPLPPSQKVIGPSWRLHQ